MDYYSCIIRIYLGDKMNWSYFFRDKWTTLTLGIISFFYNIIYYFDFKQIIYAFLTIFLYLLKCPQSLILSALRAFCFCGKPHISRSIFLYFRYQTWLKSW